MTDALDRSEPPGALAALSHELKTPLSAIIGFADAMRDRAFGPLDGKYAECADTIHAAATHMAALIDDLTEVARIEDGCSRPHLERIDARWPVAEALRLFTLKVETAGVSLRADLASVPIMIDGDPRAIRQIAINLVANALAVTPHGGWLSVGLMVEHGHLRLTVEDTGPGAARAVEGLGLRLVRALCALHGGGFTLAAASGGGALATARLPLKAGG